MPFPNTMTQEEREAFEAQLAIEEAARQAEIARVEALTARFNAIPDVHLAVHLAGLQISNPALVLKEAIESNDDSNLSLLEAQVVNVQAKIDQETINRNARKFLADTDYKVIRHYEQKLANVQCSMSDLEFNELMLERQNKRNSIVE